MLHALIANHFVLHCHELHLLVRAVRANSSLFSRGQGRIGAHDAGLSGTFSGVLA
jgi:hypothetical protein